VAGRYRWHRDVLKENRQGILGGGWRGLGEADCGCVIRGRREEGGRQSMLGDIATVPYKVANEACNS